MQQVIRTADFSKYSGDGQTTAYRFGDGPTPCDGCENSKVCNSEQIACHAYRAYQAQNTGTNNPHKWINKRRIPTQAIFQEIYGETA